MEGGLRPSAPAESVAHIVRKLQRGEARYGIASSLIGEVGANDLDGVRWRLAVSDGLIVGVIDAILAGSNGGDRERTFDPATVEFTVEKASSRFPHDERLRELLAASPIVLHGLESPRPPVLG